AGEKAVVETQRAITRISGTYGHTTELIAASLRHYNQLKTLAGTDLYTMPPKVAIEGRKNLDDNFRNMISEDYTPGLTADSKKCGIGKFWEVDPELEKISVELGKTLPLKGIDLENRFRDAGFEDVFPVLSGDELAKIDSDGKIPLASRWEGKIEKGKLAPDTLLNLAGLYSFTADQAMLDKRIEEMIK
ncbi:MAG: transaldolase family protein, partial [Bacteroidales bacterium]|nr:transaldolase family protein [Bacteroidales bacterium]